MSPDATTMARSAVIREAMASDLSSIVTLLNTLHLRPEHVLAVNARYWVVELSDGRIIGTIGMEYAANAALLRSAGVGFEYQRQGIGERLTQTVLSACKEMGFSTLYAFSTDAQDYWTRRGFRQVPVEELVAALPDAPQVHLFREIGWLPTEVAWRYDLSDSCRTSG